MIVNVSSCPTPMYNANQRVNVESENDRFVYTLKQFSE